MINQENAVELRDVEMHFNMSKEKLENIKEYFLKLVKRQLMFEDFIAVDKVSFDIKKGDVFGIVGLNGSGKSTTLKIISGILKPTKGTVETSGIIAPLIELGAGFDMELTARENVYLNGAVLGHDRAYMDEHFKNIIDFAELWDFVDVPVKNYSSGMIARLGFSIATEVRADILACDEILSVGDFMFQQKCHQRMEQMQALGERMQKAFLQAQIGKIVPVLFERERGNDFHVGHAPNSTVIKIPEKNQKKSLRKQIFYVKIEESDAACCYGQILSNGAENPG